MLPAVAVCIFMAPDFGVIDAPEIAHPLNDECTPVIIAAYFMEAVLLADGDGRPEIQHLFFDRHPGPVIVEVGRQPCHAGSPGSMEPEIDKNSFDIFAC
jgi:hypothetical protein